MYEADKVGRQSENLVSTTRNLWGKAMVVKNGSVMRLCVKGDMRCTNVLKHRLDRKFGLEFVRKLLHLLSYCGSRKGILG